MSKFILSLVMVLSLAAVDAQATKECELCKKVEKWVHDLENEDEQKAYADFEDFMMRDIQFSKDPEMRQREFDALVRAVVDFLPADENRILPDYLVSYKQKYPKEFERAFKKLSASEQASLDRKMGVAAGMRTHGEDFADPDKKLDEIEVKRQKMNAKKNGTEAAAPAPLQAPTRSESQGVK